MEQQKHSVAVSKWLVPLTVSVFAVFGIVASAASKRPQSVRGWAIRVPVGITPAMFPGIKPAIFRPTDRPWHTSEMSATFRSVPNWLIWACISPGIACLLGAALCFRYVHVLSFWRCTVVNTNNAHLIDERGDGPRQNPRTIGLLRFRTRIAPLLRPDWNTVATIAALRHWARTQQSSDRELWCFPPDADSGDVDPGILLEQQHALTPGACRRFGYILAGALVSAGIPARLVSLQTLFTDGSGHIMVEAWVDGVNKWILVDPTADTMFLVDGRYGSLLELRNALLSGRLDRIQFERNGSILEPAPNLKYFSEIARHAFVFTNECFFTDPPRTKASLWRTRVIHYVDEHATPYPECARRALLVGVAAFVVCGSLFLGVACVLAVRLT
jgi:transglutaminase superfamily protein